MSFRQTAASWLVAQVEPLVTTLERVVLEDSFVSLMVDDVSCVSWWFSGVITDQVLTLPPNDPWRHLSARAGPLTRGQLPRPPEGTGATGYRGQFGTIEDGHDLAHPSFTDPSTDVGLAALSQGLSAGGAALLAFAADGWEAAAAAARSLHVGHMADTGDEVAAAGQLFGDLVGAFRWAAWRRRAYTGPADMWTISSGFAWLWRAEQLAGGNDLTVDGWDEVRRAVAAEAIDPGTYSEFSGSGF